MTFRNLPHIFPNLILVICRVRELKAKDMDINKIIIGLTLSLLLSYGGAANAFWGHSYACETIDFVYIPLDGRMERIAPTSFSFKLDRTKNAMVFGNSGALPNEEFKIDKGWNVGNGTWSAKGLQHATGISSIFFKRGKILYSGTGESAAMAFSGWCRDPT